MTKDTYFEMCEMLGSCPIEEEVPVEIDDFPELVQQVLVIYDILSDRWDPMGGCYLGKDYTILFKLFELYGISDKHEVLLSVDFIRQVDYTRSIIIQEKQKLEKPAT
jgi:hypothetical protein